MDVKLQNRKVVITGAGEGIGRSLALAFAEEGARVAVCARSAGRLADLAKIIQGKGHVFEPADLSKPADTQDFFQEVMKKFGGLDILVNNVGSILKMANFLDLTDEDWLDSFNINLMPAVRLTRLFLPALRESGAARIINISSIAAKRPGDVFPHYSAMKAALSNLTVSLAQTLAPDKILVNSVSPGPVWTRSWESEVEKIAENTGSDVGEIKDKIIADTAEGLLLKRMGAPEDIRGLVLFLASEQAGWINASNFTADGGLTMDPF